MHSAKAKSSIILIDGGNFTRTNDLHSEKAKYLIFCIVGGISICFSLVHLSNSHGLISPFFCNNKKFKISVLLLYAAMPNGVL